jgi:hypothetical protein
METAFTSSSMLASKQCAAEVLVGLHSFNCVTKLLGCRSCSTMSAAVIRELLRILEFWPRHLDVSQDLLGNPKRKV